MNSRNMHTLFSMAVFVTGVVLLAFMILVEDEPGAIPLLLMAAGAAWFAATRLRTRSQARDQTT